MEPFTVSFTVDPMIDRTRLADLLRELQSACHANINRSAGSGKVRYIEEQGSLAQALSEFADAVESRPRDCQWLRETEAYRERMAGLERIYNDVLSMLAGDDRTPPT